MRRTQRFARIRGPALVLNEPRCYHFHVLDPRLPLCGGPHRQGHDHLYLRLPLVAEQELVLILRALDAMANTQDVELVVRAHLVRANAVLK